MRLSVTYAFLAAALVATPAVASNSMILLNPDDLFSTAIIDISGNDNRLVIDQSYAGAGQGNTVDIRITGDRNGGPVGAAFTGPAARNGLTPGSLFQHGAGNSVRMQVTGADNLFAVAQVGSNNRVEASIVGFGNQASVAQTGTGNFAYFRQNGMGNIISVRQTAW
jgi:hypothetical protein